MSRTAAEESGASAEVSGTDGENASQAKEREVSDGSEG
jgi:hypothetical protein